MKYSDSPAVTDYLFSQGIAAHVALTAAALLASVPFLIPVHLILLPTFYPETIALGLGLVVVAAVAAGAWRAGEVQVPRLTILFALFALVVYGQSFIVAIPYREHAELWMWYLLWAAALIFAGRAMRFQIGMATVVTVLATAVAIGALLAAGSGLAQWLTVSDYLSPLVATGGSAFLLGNVMQHNLFANYLLLGIVSVAYLWHVRRIGTPLLIGTLVLLAFNLQFASSRASLLMLAGLTISVVIWRWHASISNCANANRWLYAALFAWLLILLSMQLAQLPSISEIGYISSNASMGGTESMSRALDPESVRLFHFEKAWGMFLSSPWFGVGVGSYAWQNYILETVWINSPAGGFGIENNAHNIVLHFLAEFGVVGLLFLCLLAVMAIRGIAREIRVRATPESIWIAAVVLAETLHSLVEYPLWHAHFLGLAALALGGSAEGLRWQPRWKVMRMVLAGLALTGAGLLAIHWSFYNRLVAAFGLSDTPRAQIPLDDMIRMRNTLLRPYIDVAIAQSFAMDRLDLDHKLEFNQRIMQFWPIYPLVHNQILLLTIAGRDKEARALLERARRVDWRYIGKLKESLAAVPDSEIPADSWLRAAVLGTR